LTTIFPVGGLSVENQTIGQYVTSVRGVAILIEDETNASVVVALVEIVSSNP
jgi:hypothetical protein